METEEKKVSSGAAEPSVEIEASKSHYEGESFELKVRYLLAVYKRCLSLNTLVEGLFAPDNPLHDRDSDGNMGGTLEVDAFLYI